MSNQVAWIGLVLNFVVLVIQMTQQTPPPGATADLLGWLGWIGQVLSIALMIFFGTQTTLGQKAAASIQQRLKKE